MKYVNKIFTPQLNFLHAGKVRESFRVDNDTRLILVTDRISSFDKILNNFIPYKGAVLNSLSAYWFEKFDNIVENHFISMLDPNVSLVKEAEPIKIEMIVRNYITGSMWRRYQKGKRHFSGVTVRDGLMQNQKLDEPILTPTTKGEVDLEITPQEIINQGIVNSNIYGQMETISLHLFNMVSEDLKEKGIILVDTKLEFGLIDGRLVLIDEIFTPDSSRFWDKNEYEIDPINVESMDKEFIRKWLLKNERMGTIPDTLPEKIVEETSLRYLNLYERIVGNRFKAKKVDPKKRIYDNLVKEGIIKDAYILIIMGSPSDLEHATKIKNQLMDYDVFTQFRVISAHKNGEKIPELAEILNNSMEPGAVIAVAGLSNGLGGALAANLAIPVINCPPFSDKMDMMLNINSSLMMPSNAPAVTVTKSSLAAQAALRCLNLQRLKKVFMEEISQMKHKLEIADKKYRAEDFKKERR